MDNTQNDSLPNSKEPNSKDSHLSNEEFLVLVGNRVRRLRASRGMSRKLLSKHSDVSERYLANLEQGCGNISINLLRQVADALNTSIGDILPSSKRLTPEQTLINDFVSRMQRNDQRATLQMLYQKFSNLANTHTRIALIGLRGAGKTTIGEVLEKEQKLPLVRLSAKIEAMAGIPLSEILNLSGQQGYRRLEEKALYETLNENDSCCIEAGGSIVSEFKGLNLLMTTCLVVWVKTTPEEHMERVIKQGDLRPIIDNEDAMADLKAILEERTPYYEQAHITLDTTGKTPQESYAELMVKIHEYKQNNQQLESAE